MNAPERNVVRLAFCLLVIGIVMRFLPWGLPSIESFEVGESIIVANESPLTVFQDSVVADDKLVSKNDAVLQIQPK